MNSYDRIEGMIRTAETHRQAAARKRSGGDLNGAAINERYAAAIEQNIEHVMAAAVAGGKI